MHIKQVSLKYFVRFVHFRCQNFHKFQILPKVCRRLKELGSRLKLLQYYFGGYVTVQPIFVLNFNGIYTCQSAPSDKTPPNIKLIEEIIIFNIFFSSDCEKSIKLVLQVWYFTSLMLFSQSELKKNSNISSINFIFSSMLYRDFTVSGAYSKTLIQRIPNY